MTHTFRCPIQLHMGQSILAPLQPDLHTRAAVTYSLAPALCVLSNSAYPYLVIPGGVNGYNGCVNGNIFAILCGNPLIPNSVANFPRAINIYPIGLTGAPYTAYSYIPSSPTNAIYGHISMVWNAFDSGE